MINLISHMISLQILLRFAHSEQLTYNFTFTYGNIAPDNYLQRGILINNQFPGPTINTKPNDTLIINAINYLDDGITVHCHGLHQQRTQRSDGVPHVTQDLIPVNGSYRYEMNIGSQYGTFLYHTHTKFDHIWAYGLLIIDDSHLTHGHSNYYYDEQLNIIISQCWHTSISDMYNGVMGSPFVDVPDTDSILINGRSFNMWNDSDVLSSQLNTYPLINVEPNKIYRLRVVGFGDSSMVSFMIEKHNMTIIEADGVLVDPVVVDHLEINVAQRYSVLIHTNQTPGNYIIKSELMPESGPNNGLAFLHYNGTEQPKLIKNMYEKTKERKLDEWILPHLHPSTTISDPLVYSVPKSYDHEIHISALEQEINNYTKISVNDIIFEDPEVDFLTQFNSGKTINHSGVYNIREAQIVQIVFQNRFNSEGVCEQHPWHLHGHTFYIVGYGADAYQPDIANSIIDQNIANNVVQFRDVLTLYPNRTDNNTDTGTPCGWIVIRFAANNPGVWLTHCHLTADMLIGMKFVVAYYNFAYSMYSTAIFVKIFIVISSVLVIY